MSARGCFAKEHGSLARLRRIASLRGRAATKVTVIGFGKWTSVRCFAEDATPDSACPPPSWIRGHVVDGLHDAEENEKQMSEVFRAALDEGRGERVYELLLDSLGSVAHFHFGFEERCMKRRHCPAVQQNAQAESKVY